MTMDATHLLCPPETIKAVLDWVTSHAACV